jgi:hypothetical protein
MRPPLWLQRLRSGISGWSASNDRRNNSLFHEQMCCIYNTNPNKFRPIVPHRNVVNSVVEPDVSGPPESESGSNSMRYGSGSGSKSFYNQAKIVLKKFLLFCNFFMTFYL